MSPVHLSRTVIGQIAGVTIASSRLSRQKFEMAKSVGEELHLTLLDKDNDLLLEKCGKHKGRIGIGNEFLKITRRMDPLIGWDKLSYLIFT